MEFWPEFLAGSWGREFVVGGVGGMAGVIAGHPLDTLRIHLQQPRMGPSSAPNSALSLIRRINAVGGPLAFFKGMGAPLSSVSFLLPIYLLGTRYYKAHCARAKLIKLLDKLIFERKRENEASQRQSGEFKDLVSTLITAKNEDGNALTQSEIVDTIITLVFAAPMTPTAPPLLSHASSSPQIQTANEHLVKGAY